MNTYIARKSSPKTPWERAAIYFNLIPILKGKLYEKVYTRVYTKYCIAI